MENNGRKLPRVFTVVVVVGDGGGGVCDGGVWGESRGHILHVCVILLRTLMASV